MQTQWWAAPVLGLFLGLLGLCPPVLAQTAAQDTVIARFRDARALATDPLGRVYVADAGRDVVRVFNRDGDEQGSLGGAGTRAGEF
ncbi:MAG TPA: hypothetical protein VJ884_03315, partial [Salinibacter sp.]|nr:hypothetical protein [Salinibacter sp.]